MNVNYSKVLIAATAAVLFVNVPAYASDMDNKIELSVKQSYVFKTYLKDDSIKTESIDGVVTLKGTVKEESHKSLAQETVINLPGVKSVDNQLVFKGESPAENSDGWISMQVKYSLLYNRHVSGINTQVFVSDGVVTLQGVAQNQAQKDLAGEYAKDIKNVKGVNNEITVSPSEQTMGEKMDDASITAQVKMALLTYHSTSAFKTGVTTTDGVVTLSGETTTAAGKEMVSKVAGDVNGVTKVINNMTIAEFVSNK